MDAFKKEREITVLLCGYLQDRTSELCAFVL